ncbi:MAG: class I SAM-dependent methyltransferase [Gemmatimonadetes bacterium]|nr:class I SAM-dependent methyltransferase [Gemmatimonadota bacterium]
MTGGEDDTVRLPQNSYDAFARVYDAAQFDRFALSLIATARELVDATGGEVVDLACGSGSFLARFLEVRSPARVTGIDRSRAMLDRARGKRPDVFWVCGDMVSIPLNAEVDALFCLYDSLNYLDSEADLKRAFREWRRLLKPGGKALFDLNRARAYERVWGDPTPFVSDTDDGKLTIVTSYSAEKRRGEARIRVDFADGTSQESHHVQTCFPEEVVRECVASAGLHFLSMTGIDPFPGTESSVPGAKSLWIVERAREDASH